MYADLCHHFKPHQHVEQSLPVILRGKTLSADFRHYITSFGSKIGTSASEEGRPGKMKEKRNNQK